MFDCFQYHSMILWKKLALFNEVRNSVWVVTYFVLCLLLWAWNVFDISNCWCGNINSLICNTYHAGNIFYYICLINLAYYSHVQRSGYGAEVLQIKFLVKTLGCWNIVSFMWITHVCMKWNIKYNQSLDPINVICIWLNNIMIMEPKEKMTVITSRILAPSVGFKYWLLRIPSFILLGYSDSCLYANCDFLDLPLVIVWLWLMGLLCLLCSSSLD
jgi:hypothetical protein